MELKEKSSTTFENLSLLSPTQLQEKAQKGELVVGCNFTEQEQTKISKLADQIDIMDRAGLISYGAGAQDKLTKFSNERLANYNTSKLNEAGDALTNLMVILKTYNPELANNSSTNFLVKLFKQKKQSIAENIEAARAQFTSVAKNLDEAERILMKEHYEPLISRVTDFDEMYNIIIDFYHELSMYIAAGQERLDKAKSVELPALDKKAQESQSNLDVQILRDFADAINSFEANLYCLESSRELCIFDAAAIRQYQKLYANTAKQIWQFVHQAGPHWRVHMNLGLCAQDIDSAQHAIDATRDFTSTLFVANAEALRDLTLRTANNANKPIISIETSVIVNDIYIDTLNKELEISRQNMVEVREGRKIVREIEEKRNDALRNYAIESGRIALENAYINENPNKSSLTFDDDMRESTGNKQQFYKIVEDENSTAKKYTLD